MRRSRPQRRFVPAMVAASVAAALVLGAMVFPAGASPVCTDLPAEVCGGRVFAEASNSVTFIQHDNNEYRDGIQKLATDFPRFVKVRKLSEILDDPDAQSAGGRPLWVIEVTDFDAPEDGKVPVMVSLSVHGNERAGLEGGVRYAEDLARWATSDRDHPLMNGTDNDSRSFPVSKVLKRVHLYLSDINPDGWAAGDVGGPLFSRTNDNGTDLNREFPTMGWSKNSYTPLSDPESIAWTRFTEMVKPRVTADLHGELDSVNNAFADMMYPAGQWDPLKQAQEDALARHMKSNVARYFDENGVTLGTVAGAAAGMKPADYATGFDVVGYDDSGFIGDFFTQAGAIDMDVEHFLSHSVPNNVWLFPLEQAHIAAVRGEIETLMVEGMVTDRLKLGLDLGEAGYVFNPTVVTDSDANGYGGPKPRDGYTPESYSATPMQYFEDLSEFTEDPLRRVMSSSVAGGGLNGLESLVITDDPFPESEHGRPLDRTAYTEAIKSFVRDGGNLVLTDRGINLLADMGIVQGSAISKSLATAGHINIDNFKDAYTAGLAPTASQTYYEVPLGFSVGKDTAPHWTVAKDAWEAAGGKSIAHVDDEDRIGLGRMSFGDGTIGIIGALLPTPTEEFDHYYGLADYGVTVAGGHILNRMLDPTWSEIGPKSGARSRPQPRF